MDRKYRRHAAVAGRDLGQRQRIADMIGARAAVFLRHEHPHKAELAQFGQRLRGEPRFAVPRRRLRRQQVLRHVARRIAQQDLLFGQAHDAALIYVKNMTISERSLMTLFYRRWFSYRRIDPQEQHMSDADQLPGLIKLASDPGQLQNAQQIAAQRLLDFDGEVYPQDGCAITLSVLLQDAGIDVPDT